MTLLGPDNADHYRVKVGRWKDRWYVDPLKACDVADATDAAWPSISHIKGAAGKDWSFLAIRRAAAAIAKDPDRFRGDADTIRASLSAAEKAEKQTAFDRGTAVHQMFEDGLRGKPIKAWLEGQEYEDTVKAFFAERQPRLIAAEVVCINRTLHGRGYGGTCDAIVEMDGGTYIVDWKSRGGEHDAYPEEAAQVAGYALADYMITSRGRAPMPIIDGALIVSIKPDGYRIYPVRLGAAAGYFTAMHAYWCAAEDIKGDGATFDKPWAPMLHAVPAATPDLHEITDLQLLRTLWGSAGSNAERDAIAARAAEVAG